MQISPGRHLLQKFAVFLLLCIACYLTYLVYFPGLGGTFVFDDYPNIVSNPSLNIQQFDAEHLSRAAFSSGSGPLRRPISMLSFALNSYFTGSNPYFFKLTNLVIHVTNGIGIYILSLLLLLAHNKRNSSPLSNWQLQLVGVAAASAWMLHPFNLTSVLYVVQRMNSLSIAFCIWGLIVFTWGRMRLSEGSGGFILIFVSLFIFTPLAILSKESGALLPAFMLAIELCIFRFSATTLSARRFLAAFFGISVFLPAAALLAFIAANPSWLGNSFIGRSFNLSERLMTESRVMWFYLREIVLPDPVQMGLFHDDIAISRSLLDPVTTIPSILGLIGLFVITWVARKKAPLISFGLLFFFAGHLLESTIFPLEISFEHRNYLAMFGILLTLFYYLLYPLKYVGLLHLRRGIAFAFIALFAYDTWSRAEHWSNPFDLAQSEVENHPNSARDNGEMGNSYASITTEDEAVSEAYYWKARHYYERSAAVNPDYTNGLMAVIMITSAKNKPLDPAWINDLKHRLEFSPSEADVGGNLLKLVNCQSSNRCKLENQQMADLIFAALRNPTLNGGKRSQILFCLSFFYVNVAHDYPRALDAMYQMTYANPQEITYHLSLLQLLVAMQKPVEAKAQIALIRPLDRLHEYTRKIDDLERQISKP